MSCIATRSGTEQTLRSVFWAVRQQAQRDGQAMMRWLIVLWLCYLLTMLFTRRVVPSSVRVAANPGAWDDIRRLISRFPTC